MKTGFNKLLSGFKFLKQDLCYFLTIPKYKIFSLFELESLHKTFLKLAFFSSFPESNTQLPLFYTSISYFYFGIMYLSTPFILYDLLRTSVSSN